MEPVMIAGAAASAIGGSGVSTWFIRAMVHRTLKGYDEAHKEARDKLGKQDDTIAALQTKIAVLETVVAEVKPLREESSQLRERMALAEAKLTAAWAKLDQLAPMIGCSTK